MIWTGTFLRDSTELSDGVAGYFAIPGLPVQPGIVVGTALNIPITLPSAPTSTNVTFRASNVLGEITFTGQNLAVSFVNSANAPGNFPIFTTGTITGIEYRYNTVLSRNLREGNNDPAFFDERFLLPSAQISLPNVSAAGLSQAVLNSYATASATPLLNFVSTFQLNYTGSDGTNILFGANNNDLLNGLGGDDALFGGAGDDTLIGGPGTDAMEGGEGSDFFLPGAGGALLGDNVRDTGTNPGDIDTLSYENAPAGLVIDLNIQDGNASTGFAAGLMAAGIERVIGSSFNDTIIGEDVGLSLADVSEILIGGPGNDLLIGLGGSDTLQGGAGFDTLIGGTNGLFTFPGTGDVAQFNVRRSDAEVFFLTDGTTLIATETGGVDQLQSIEFVRFLDQTVPITSLTPSGFQLFRGTPTNETINGGDLADLMYGRAGGDTISAFGGNDVLNAGDGNDLLFGGSGGDTLFGGNGADTVEGGEGNDLISGGLADDSLSGGLGFDTLSGDDGADVLTGGNNDDVLFGGLGDDQLLGDRGNDTLQGGDGTDTLNGGEGDDDILGGDSDQDRRDLIFAGDGNDTIDAGFGNDEVFGQDGNDVIAGGFGADELFGQNGNDVITGSAFSDLVFGGAGDDFVNGGFGFDRINGGTGADKFFHAAADGHGSDWLQDYSAAEGDVLVFGGSGASASDFVVRFAHTATPAGERSGDDDVQEAFVNFRGQTLWALVDGGGQEAINIQIGVDTFDLLA